MSVRLLRRASVLYLLLPNLLFFFFWTSGVLKILGLALSLYIFWNVISEKEYDQKPGFSVRDLLVLAFFSVILTCVSGVSSICYQTFDHWCHNVKFYELFKYEWPIRIPSDGPVIAYYYGYYLVPALYAKLVGHISEPAIFIWTFAGFFLGSCWLYLVLHKKIGFVFLALTIGDLPHVIKTGFYRLNGYLYEFGDFGVEAWSNFENLLWVPNQVIPTLIIGGMLIYHLKEQIAVERLVLPVALTFWWAVFPAFTSGLLIGIVVIFKWIDEIKTFKIWPAVKEVVLPFLACLPVLILYLSHNTAPISGFVWEFPDKMDSRVIEYFINIGLNVLVFYLAFRFINRSGNGILPALPFYIALFFIFIFPVYRIGKVNDFLFRGLMPLLIIIGLYVYQSLSATQGVRGLIQRAVNAPMLIALGLLLASSSLIAAGRIVRAARVNTFTMRIAPDLIRFEPIPYDQYANIYEVLQDKWSQQEADQYLGKEDSIYEHFIAPAKP